MNPAYNPCPYRVLSPRGESNGRAYRIYNIYSIIVLQDLKRVLSKSTRVSSEHLGNEFILRRNESIASTISLVLGHASDL